MRGFIVTGTDTGVGKTVVAAGLTAHLGARYWKPVQAGLDGETDSETVARLASGRVSTLHLEAYRLRTPCSPHEAARIDGLTIDPACLTPPSGEGPLIIEGAGGVLVPLADGLLSADMFARWDLPVILVARTQLGTINHSLLSLEALRSRGLTVAGVVFCGDANPASEAAIMGMGRTVHLGRLPMLGPLTSESLAEAFARNIQIEHLQ
jgi:dethiobiotin synthetase